ncbi:MAG: phage tail tape measure protein, partial [Muribaculaceae bacterium]|nr:phage tail tape measure protein [Muribaculaceae bacterium]
SVINELSQNCSASAPYIANFTERMAGVGAQANMTIPEIMGFAAVLDSSSQKVEASATAVSQVLVRLYQDPAKYAKVAGLDVQEFSDLLKKDANEALILFLETLNKAGGMDVLSPMFKDMGENGSRAIAALSTLASKIEEVKSQQQVANEAFREGSSIDTEFNVQNNTVAAGLDKCKNAAHEYQVELGERLYPLMSHFLSSSAAVARGLLTVLRFLFDHKAAIVNLTVAILAYVAAMKASAIETRILAAETAISKAVFASWTATVKLGSAILALCTGNIQKARTAWLAFNTAIKASPIGLVVGLLALLITHIVQLTSKTDEYKESADEAMKSATSFAEAMSKEKKEIDELFGKLEAAKKGTKEYNNAKEAIISRYGVYLRGLLNEKGEITNLALAYDRLTWAAQKSAQARGVTEAKKNLQSTFYSNVDDQTEKLRNRLLDLGMSTRDVTRIISSVSSSLASGQDIPSDIRKEVLAFENEKRPWYDSLIGNDSPMGIINELGRNLIDFRQRSDKLDKMDGRDFSDMSTENLNKQLDSLTEALKSPAPIDKIPIEITVDSEDEARRIVSSYGERIEVSANPKHKKEGLSLGKPSEILGSYDTSGSTVSKSLSWSTDSSNKYSVSGNISRSMAEKLFRELTYEKSQRWTPESQPASPPGDDYNPSDNQPLSSSPNQDRFAKEKAWREREEAEARLAYAKGESLYEDYKHEMLAIAEEYNQMLLDRKDLSSQEQLSIQADYWETVNKRLVGESKESADKENARYEDALSRHKVYYTTMLQDESLSASERAAIEAEYMETVEMEELEHQSNLVNIYKAGSDERAKAQQKYQDAQIAAAKRHRQKMDSLEVEYSKIKKDYFGNNAGEDKALYDKQLANLRIVYERELQAAQGNASEKLRIEKAFLEAQAALRKMYNQESESDTRNSMQKAVDSSIEWLNSDGGKALTGTLSTLVSGMSSVFSGLSTMIQAELQIQTAAIESKYDKEIKYAEGNSYRVAKAEKQKEAEIAKVKNEANRKMFAMQVIQAVAQTATNALNAYGSAAAVPVVGHILAPIAAAMAVAAGAIQIASIKKQQQASETQGYSKGGFTKPGAVDEPAGIVHAGEWVASQKLLASPVARPMIEALDYAQRTNTIGSLRGEDVSRSITATQSISRIADGSPSAALMASAMAKNAGVIDRLVRRLEEPFVTVNTVTGDAGIKQAQDEYTKLMNNKSPKSRRKNANNN